MEQLGPLKATDIYHEMRQLSHIPSTLESITYPINHWNINYKFTKATRILYSKENLFLRQTELEITTNSSRKC